MAVKITSIRKCDRCNKEIKDKNMFWFGINRIGLIGVHKSFDLCKECQREFSKFMKG